LIGLTNGKEALVGIQTIGKDKYWQARVQHFRPVRFKIAILCE